MKHTARFERRMQDARAELVEVMKTYKKEIAQETARRNGTRNSFVKACCQQNIDQLTAERDAIDAAFC